MRDPPSKIYCYPLNLDTVETEAVAGPRNIQCNKNLVISCWRARSQMVRFRAEGNSLTRNRNETRLNGIRKGEQREQWTEVFNNFPACRYRSCGQRRCKNPANDTRCRLETITATWAIKRASEWRSKDFSSAVTRLLLPFYRAGYRDAYP